MRNIISKLKDITTRISRYIIILLSIFYIIEVCANQEVPDLSFKNSNTEIVVNKDSTVAGVHVVTSTDHSVPVVEIAAPNSKGISHNNYDKFNVGSSGVVINNSSTHLVSRLRGKVLANPNLSGGREANIIINQVTAQNPSRIEGPTEILGKRAAYILANPSGISVNGGDFINASSVTLTTGIPQYGADGGLNNIKTIEGNISINNYDLTLSGLDYFDIISKTVKLAAKINTKDLQIITGRNDYEPTSRSSSKINDGKASIGSVAIDSTLVGGLYAGRVTIVATEEGAGVNLPEIQSEKAISITADGRIVHTSLKANKIEVVSKNSSITVRENIKDNIGEGAKVEANESYIGRAKDEIKFEERTKILAKDIAIEAGSLNNFGTIETRESEGEKLDIKVGNFTNRGTIAARKNIKIEANNRLENIGKITSASGSINIATGNILNSGEINAGEILTIEAAAGKVKFDKDSKIFAKKFKFKAGDFDNIGLLKTTQDNEEQIDIEAKKFANAGKILSAGEIDLNIREEFENSGTIENWDNDKKIKIKALRVDNQNKGIIKSLSEVDLVVANLIKNHKGASIISAESEVKVEAKELINEGIIYAKEKLDASQKIENITNTGLLIGASGIKLHALNKIENRAGVISSEKAAIEGIIKELALENTSITDVNNGDITLSAAEIINADKGKIKAARTFVGTVTYNMKNLAESEISAAKAVTFAGSNTANFENAAQILSDDIITFTGNRLDNKGIIKADAVITASMATILENSGEISSTKNDVKLEAFNITNLGNILAKTGKLVASSDIITNKAKGVLQAGRVEIGSTEQKVKNIINEEEGLISALSGDVVLNGKELNNEGKISAKNQIKTEAGDFEKIINKGEVLAELNVVLQASDIIDNEGKIVAGNMLTLNGDKLDNKGTIQGAAGAKVIMQASLLNSGEISSERNDLELEAKNITNSNKILANGGKITAIADILTNNANGKIQGGRVEIGSKDHKTVSIINEKDALISASHGDIVLNGKELDNKGDIEAKGKIETAIEGGSFENITNSGKIHGGLDVILKASNQINNAGGKIISDEGGVQLAAAKIINSGEIRGHNFVDITSNGNFTNDVGGIIFSPTKIALKVGELTNQGNIGKYIINNDSEPNKPGIFMTHHLTITADSAIDNSGIMQGKDLQILKASKIDNSGKMLGSNELIINADNDIVNSGSMHGKELKILKAIKFLNSGDVNALSLQTNLSNDLINRGKIFVTNGWSGTIDGNLINESQAGKQASLTFAGDSNLTIKGKIENTIGSFIVALKGILTLKGAIIDNKGKITIEEGTATKLVATNNIGEAILTGDLTSKGDLTLSTDAGVKVDHKFLVDGNLILEGITGDKKLGGLINHSIIQSGKNLIINTKKLDITNNDAEIKSFGERLDITTDAFSSKGKIIAKNVKLIANSNVTELGTIGATASADLDIVGDLTIIAGHAINSEGTLNLNAKSLNQQGVIRSGGNLTLTIGGGTNLAGIIHSGGELTINNGLHNISTQTGAQIYSLGTLTLNASRLDNASGAEIFSGSNANINVAVLSNSGVIGAAGLLGVKASSSVTNSGYLQGGSMNIVASSISNTGIMLATSGNLELIAAGGTIDNYGTIETLGGGSILRLRANTFNNHGETQGHKIIVNPYQINNFFKEYFLNRRDFPERPWEHMNGLGRTIIFQPKFKPKTNFVYAGTVPRDIIYHDGYADWYTDKIDKVYAAIEEISLVPNVAKILARGTIEIDATIANNNFAIINAGGDIKFNGVNLTNLSEDINRVTISHENWLMHRGGHYTTNRWDMAIYHTTSSKVGTVSGVINAGGSVFGTISGEFKNGAPYAPSGNGATLIKPKYDGAATMPAKEAITAAPSMTNEQFQAHALNSIEHEEVTTGGDVVKEKRAALLKSAHIEFTQEVIPDLVTTQSNDIDERFWDDFSFEDNSKDHDLEGSDWTFSHPSEIYATRAPNIVPKSYRIETNPEFLEASRFFSSEKFTSKIPAFKYALETSGLQPHLYMKILRDQVYSLAGILEHHSSDEELLVHLYASADAESKRLNLSANISLSKEQVAALRQNIVWHEEIVRGGKTYFVPRLYLASGTKVKTGMVASKEINIAAKNIDNAHVMEAPTITLTAEESVNNVGGTMIAKNLAVNAGSHVTNVAGYMEGTESFALKAGGDFVNIAGTVAGGEGSIEARNVISTSTTSTESTHRGHIDKITGQATLDFTGHLAVNTQENQEYIASNLRAGSLALNAGGDVSLTALGLTSESRTGSGKNYHNEYRLQHVGTNFDVAGDSKISAGGNFESLGSNVRIGGDSTVAAGGVVHIASLVDVTETESSKTTSKRNAWGTSSTKTTNSFSHTETLSGGTFAAGGKSEFSGDAGIRAEGAKVAAVGGTRFESLEGAIELLGNRTVNTTSTNSKYKDMAIQANSASSRTTELAGNTEISGGVEFGEAKDGIKLEADKRKANGFVDVISGRSDAQIIDNHDKTTSHYQRQAQLTPELSAGVAILATLATAGAASGLSAAMLGTGATATAGTAATLTMTQAVGQAVIGAGVASASSQFAVSAINNQGNLGAAAKTTFSSSGLQSIGTSMAVAGVSTAIMYNMPKFAAETAPSLRANEIGVAISNNTGNAFLRATADRAVRATVNAGVNTVIAGVDFNKSLKLAAINEATSAVFEAVGDFAATKGMADGSASKVALHTGVGAGVAKLMGADPLIGALAAGTSEGLSGHIDNAGDIDSRIKTAGVIGAVTAFAAGGDAKTINAAASLTESARANNRELHSDETKVLIHASKGKSAEERERLEDAALFLVHGADSIPNSDPSKAYVQERVARGAGYTKEQEMLKASAEKFGVSDKFEYSEKDGWTDWAARHDEAITRLGGGVRTLSGVTGAALSGAGLAISPFGTLATTAVVAPLAAAGFTGSYEYATAGFERATGKYESHEGERVLSSLTMKVPSYGSELAFGTAEATFSAALNLGGAKGLTAVKAGAGTGISASTSAESAAVRSTAASSEASVVQAEARAGVGVSEKAADVSKMVIKRDKTGSVTGVTHTQEHHIIHQKLTDHELWERAGMNVEDSANKMLLPTKKGAELSTTKRSIHDGRHVDKVKDQLEIQMDRLLEVGKEKGYTTEQYREGLVKIINNEQQFLKEGKRALNKNARPWAIKNE